jgi:tripartite-type tricarboxylate transporter receptor subunit TctC
MKFLQLLLCIALGAPSLVPGAAQAQPAGQPLKLVVGYPAGGSADAVARILADKLKDELGTAVIVDNRAGAGGQIAADYVRTAPADGGTLLVANSHMMVMLPLTTKSVRYNAARDFRPIGRITSFYEAVTVPASLPAASVSQWLEAARHDAKAANFGVPAAGSVSHFLGYRLGLGAKTNLQAIPYKGAAPLVQDLLGGQIQAGILPILDVAPHHQAGKLKVLAVNGSKRAQILPAVPTLKELGLAGFDTLEWTALLAPAATPKAVTDRLNAALNKVLAAPDIQEKLLKLGMEANPGTPEDLGQLIAADVATWGPVVKASGFTAE